MWRNPRVRAVVDFRETDQGDVSEETGGKCLWRKARQPRKQGNTAESCVGGGPITITSLFPQASISS